MKLYYFPSPNPQKIRFAINELGIECDDVPVNLLEVEQRKPEFLALNPYGRVPVLTDGDVVLWESHAILAYLGDKTGKLWPTSVSGRAEALKWMFFLTSAISPSATEVAFNRIAVKLRGGTPDEAAIERGEKGLIAPMQVIEQRLAANKWMLGSDFSLVDCDYGPTFNVLEKAGFNFGDFPKTHAYLKATCARRAWQETPRLPGL